LAYQLLKLNELGENPSLPLIDKRSVVVPATGTVTFQSPNYPDPYPKNVDYTFVVMNLEGSDILVNMNFPTPLAASCEKLKNEECFSSTLFISPWIKRNVAVNTSSSGN
jgi:hypothetical protein